MKYLSYVLSIIGLCIFLMTCMWSKAFLKGLSASSYVQKIVSSNVLLGKERMLFLPALTVSFNQIATPYSYTKTMHQRYHYMARVAQFVWRIDDAIVYMLRSLECHPYYMNGYKELAGLQRYLGNDNASTACENVKMAIMEVKHPKTSDVEMCKMH